jgi:uncharacterized protein DUF4231
MKNMNNNDPTLERLENQIGWYNDRSNFSQRIYKTLKFGTLCAAAFIPFSAGLQLRAGITGGLGVLVVVLEGLQQLGQYDHNWISYRSTCEALKHEKFLYLAKAGPYATAEDAHTLLAERIESLVSQEHAKWVSSAEETLKRGGQSTVDRR